MAWGLSLWVVQGPTTEQRSHERDERRREPVSSLGSRKRGKVCV